MSDPAPLVSAEELFDYPGVKYLELVCEPREDVVPEDLFGPPFL
jgi:hypothetical protein